MSAAIAAVRNNLAGGVSPGLKRTAWIIGIVFVLLIALFAYIKIRAKIKENKERKKISYVEGGGVVQDDFKADAWADFMFGVMDGVFTTAETKLDAACQMMTLNDNQIIAVHNYWNEHLYDRNQETLYKMMKAEWNIPFITGEVNCWDQLLNRLSRLKLISK